jgi:peptide/nickel transport system substrate-binding protein
MKRFLPAAALLVVVAVVMTSCASAPSAVTPAPGQSAVAQPKSGGTIRYGLVRDPIHFDPHVSAGQSSVSLQGSVYDGLVEYNDQGKLTGALAESWEQPDPTTYIFKLRKNVVFHDGSTFDAQDVLATLDRIKDPKTAAPQGAFVSTFTKVEAPDPFTVRITLAKPNVTFLDRFVGDSNSTMFMASAADIASGFDFRKKTNGTGAFILTTWEPGGQYVFKKNAKYWKPGLPYLDEMIQVVIPDDKARVNALRSGEVDYVENVPWQELATLDKFSTYPYSVSWVMVRLNSGKAPLDNKKVRQALNFIVDRQEVMQLAFGGRYSIIDGPLQQPGNAFYWKELEGTYKKDDAKAKALLVEAGYKTPADVPPMEISVFSTFAAHNDPAQVLLQQFQKFGLRVTFKAIDVATLNSNRSNGNYQMQMDGLSFSGPDPDNLRAFFHSTAVGHAVAAKFKNDRLDVLLTQGAETTNVEQRRTIYKEAEQIILDEAPWVFLLWRPTAEAATAQVKGYIVVPGGLGGQNFGRWEYVWLDK